MVKITVVQYFQYIAEKSNLILSSPPSTIMSLYSDIIQFQLTHLYILEETATLEYLNDLFLRVNKIIIYVEFRLSIEDTPIYIYNPMSRVEILNEFIPFIYFDEECIDEYRNIHSKLLRFSQVITLVSNAIQSFNEQFSEPPMLTIPTVPSVL